MSKFYPIKTWHLHEEDFYTPDGNRPFITTDGWFGGEVIYEPKTKKVYRVGLREETDVSPEFIEKCEFELKKKAITGQVNKKNIDKILEFLSVGGKE